MALTADPAAVLLHCAIEAGDQGVFVERLAQKAGRAVGESLLAGVLIGESRNEYERHPVTLASQVRLKLDPAHIRHADIGDHTPGIVQLYRFHESLRGGKRTSYVPKRFDEIIQAGANRLIIINN
jgi:hypothetical protein